MRIAGPLLIFLITIALIMLGLAPGIGSSASSSPALASWTLPKAGTPEQALANLLNAVRLRDWSKAHAQLANHETVDRSEFIRELAGSDGSLRSLSTLQSWTLNPVHESDQDAEVRVTLHWSTAVGSLDGTYGLKTVKTERGWQVLWPEVKATNTPAQVIPVNYLRWDLVAPEGDHGAWGGQGVDAPRVRLLSMNALNYQSGSIVLGEVVNEDTVPAFVNVNATLQDSEGRAIAEESSFDKIVHVLLPKQVSPYRIDFPAAQLERVKNIKMDVKAALVPASADPVIGVMDQKQQTDALGRTELQGTLLNESGQVVNVPHVIATFYDHSGKVIWVSDGYVDHALHPQVPEPFAVEIPKAVAAKTGSYHVVVNQYSIGKD